ncbi:unnamed protein product, partial [Prorocentrum cordatum]
GILCEFERRGLSYHEVCYGTQDFVCCGVRLDFTAGRAVPQRERGWRLHRAVTALLDRGGCTPGAMEVLMGHIVHHFMLLRPALSALSSLYRIVHSSHDYCKFDVEQLRELNLVKALIPLAGVDLGAPWHPWAYCSDASLWGYAVAGFAAGVADDSLFAGIGQPPPGRGAPRRHRPARIEVEAAAAAAGGSGIPALPDAALAAHRWQLVVRGAFLFPAPIHVLEGRTTLLGLRRATRSAAAHGCRVLSIGDNLSSMMAFEKGRCANPVLRQLACQSAARQLATGIQHYHRYSESKRNPTDYDSRAADRFELGEPLATPPVPAPPAGAGPHRLRAPPRSRRRARHVLELYAGCARLTAASLDEGFRRWAPVDISRGAWHDLTNRPRPRRPRPSMRPPALALSRSPSTCFDYVIVLA